MPLITLTRRYAVQLLGSIAALPFFARAASAQAAPAARLVVLSDLHSAYERTAQLFAAVAAEVASSPAPAAILINGDVFELGNVVASRSNGAIDWLLLQKLGKLAPTFLNIGNHEPDFINDPAEAIDKLRSIGLTVVSNVVDTRTGGPFTDASTTLDLGGIPLSIVGLATAAMGTYPKASRDLMTIPNPVEWATASLPSHLAPGTLHVVLSHAGVVADRGILPLLADGSLLIGGHDHLIFDHSEGATRYLHTGSWSSLLTVVDIAADRSLSTRQVSVALDALADDQLATLIAATMAEHLTPEDRAIVGASRAAQTLGESARFTAASLAAAAGGDVGFIGHTTFGTGFPAGDISKYVFDSVVRFDGKLMKAEVDAATLTALVARSNQDGDVPLEARTGDFLYAAPASPAAKSAYTIVCNDWSAINQRSYFGREDLVFIEVPELKVKASARAALA